MLLKADGSGAALRPSARLSFPSPETWMGLEGTSKALEESFTFPIAIAVDAGPQLVPGAIVQVLAAMCVCVPAFASGQMSPSLLAWLLQGYF